MRERNLALAAHTAIENSGSPSAIFPGLDIALPYLSGTHYPQVQRASHPPFLLLTKFQLRWQCQPIGSRHIRRNRQVRMNPTIGSGLVNHKDCMDLISKHVT